MRKVLAIAALLAALTSSAQAAPSACGEFFHHSRTLEAHRAAQEWTFPGDFSTLAYAFRRGNDQFVDDGNGAVTWARKRGLTIRVTVADEVSLRYRARGPASFKVCWRGA